MDEKALESECPVCYESLTDAARTLSCGHAFCHDCVVRTFVGSSGEASIARGTIICPLCRFVTFVSKARGLGRERGQRERTLQVPLSGAPHSPRRLCRLLRWISSSALSPHSPLCPKEPCQLFIISESGRALTDEDMAEAGSRLLTAESSERRWTRCSLHCLVFLLVLFTLLALIAATMPWVLLA